MATTEREIFVVIPVRDEEDNIGLVIRGLLSLGIEFREILVVDNSSSDGTAERAEALGARVLREERRGYGAACLRALSHIRAICEESTGKGPAVIVFIDGDYSDYPEDLPLLLEPLMSDRADFVIGSRVLSESSRASLPMASRAGNKLAATLMNLLFSASYTDLGPFRAITLDALDELRMQDRSWGWTLEMQFKAAKHGLRIVELPVRYRKRAFGKSKVSGSLIGVIRASAKISSLLFVYSLKELFERRKPS